jgi:hypothetical protein
MEIDSSVREDQPDHHARQNAEDVAYALEYARWIDNLTPDEKARLEALGVGAPMLPIFRSGGGNGHADSCMTPHGTGFENGVQVAIGLPEEATDADVDWLREFADLTEKQAADVLLWIEIRRNQGSDEIKEVAADRLAKFFSHLLPKPPAVKINLQILGLRVLGARYLLNRDGMTLTELAKRAGVSKQLLDHHARRVETELDFHGWAQKSTASRAVYSEACRARWAALTPEERRARRAGNKQSPAQI